MRKDLSHKVIAKDHCVESICDGEYAKLNCWITLYTLHSHEKVSMPCDVWPQIVYTNFAD